MLQLRCGAAWTFHDWIRFPELRGQGGMSVHEAERTPILPEELPFVLESVFDHRESVEYHRLVTLGDGLLPVVKRLLDDPRCATVVWTREKLGHCLDQRSPMERVTDLMEHACDDDAIRRLLAMWPADEARLPYAVKAVAAHGGPIGLDQVAATLSGDDGHVATFAMYGIRQSAENRRLSSEAREAWWPLMVGWATRERAAAEALFAIDPERGAASLSSEEVLRADSDNLPAVLSVLTEAGKVPPPETLRRLLGELEILADGQTTANPFRVPEEERDVACAASQVRSRIGAVLSALAVRPDPATRDTLIAFARHPAADLRLAAFSSLCVLDGLAAPRRRAAEMVDNRPSVPDPVRRYHEASLLVDEVQNGGFAQYFSNSSGDGWRDALAGLREAGAIAAADALQLVLDACGKEGPPSDHSRRTDWLARRYDSLCPVMEQADGRLLADETEACLARYAYQHRAAFVPTVPLQA